MSTETPMGKTRPISGWKPQDAVGFVEQEFLLHLVPRFFGSFAAVELVDLSLEPIGLTLRGGMDLATRKPYPNKRYSIACRKRGQRAIEGILVVMKAPVESLDYTARWSVDAEVVVTHRVRYRLLDHEFDAASDDKMLWHACSPSLGGWASRWPKPDDAKSLGSTAPVMVAHVSDATHFPEGNAGAPAQHQFAEGGLIVDRHQEFGLPTLERGRFGSPLAGDRMPLAADAWVVS